MQATALIQHYNRLNGKSITRKTLKEFHADVQRHIDSVGTGPFVPDLKGIAERIAKVLRKDMDIIGEIQLIPIDVNSKKEGEILRVSKGYDVETQNFASKSGNGNTEAEQIAIASIHIDTKRFQNRIDAFSEASANSVANNYDPNKFDPVVVWKDPKAKKIFMLAGHSRLEGMKRRGSKTILGRYFQGTEEEAIKFARVESNRAANQESLVEDLAAYKLMRDGDKPREIKAATKTELQRIFKGKVGKLEAYSHLNANGLFIQSLSQSNTSNYPYLERNAQWVGIIRNQYPAISHTGEDNIFHFFYSDKSGRNIKLSKDDFFGLVKKKVNGLRKDESVLFPECSADGCKTTIDREADPQKGEAFKRLREINEALESIREKLTSKDATVRVTTDEEKKYLRATGDKLQEEKQRINRDLDLIDKSQASLFGMDGNEEYINEMKHLNSLKEKRNKIPSKFPNKKANLQAQIDKLEMAIELKYKKGLFIKKYPHLYGIECGCTEEEQVTGLGFTKDGQTKIYDMITGKVIDTMKKDGLFWRTKWDSGKVPKAMNFPTERGYRGANWVMLTLMANMNFGYSSPWFMTFNAIKKEGGTLRKKAEGWPVVYYNRVYSLNGKRITEEQFNALPKEVQEDDVDIRPFLQYYTVFNGQNIEGIDFPETKYQQRIKLRTEFERLETAEALVNNMPNRPDIDHGNRTAHYLPGSDKIDMPDKKAFDNAQDYYSVLFHELIHSTAHKSRINRPIGGDKESKEYAFEELVAELGASYLCAEAGILYHTINDSAVYLKHYTAQLEEIMKDDNKFFLKAAAAAQKAADYILDYKHEPVAVNGPQYDAFEVKTVAPTKGPLNRLQRAALEDAIKAGRTPKVNLKAKMNASKKPAPLFEEPVNDPKQASLFGGNSSGVNYQYKVVELGSYKKDFHRMYSDTIVQIHGMPGHGKTVYLLKLAKHLANGSNVLYVAREEFGRSVFDMKLKEHNIEHKNLRFTKTLETQDLKWANVIFLDSVTALKLTHEDIEALAEQYPNRNWFVVLQSTKGGDFRGSQEWEHLVDIAGEVRNRKLILRKNRLDPNNGAKADKLLTDDAIAVAKKRKEIREAVAASNNEQPTTSNEKQAA